MHRSVFAAVLIATLIPRADAEITRYLTGSAADAAPARLHGPVLNLGGGGTDVDGALQAMIDLTRGCTGCATTIDVVVLRASGEDGYNSYIHAMNGVDSVESLVITDRSDAASPALAATIEAAELVFFAGGDQCDYVRLFKDTPVEVAVEHVLQRKHGAVGGTSAGMAIQSPTAYDACVASVTSAEVLSNPYHPGATFTRGLFDWRYLDASITDQHFVARDRMGRLLGFLARQIADGYGTAQWGIAADEQTSIVVNAKGIARVYGNPGAASTAYFVLADHTPGGGEQVAPGKPLSYANFRIWKVPAGESFDLSNRPVSAGSYSISVSNGVLSGNPY